jgi:glycosyltransferase involved in cell wall biosynthesis
MKDRGGAASGTPFHRSAACLKGYTDDALDYIYNNMHVLHVIDSLAVGGSEMMLIELANASHADGLKVSVCVTRDKLSLSTLLVDDIPLWVLARKSRFDMKALRRFVSLVRENRVDVLHAHGRSTFSFLAFGSALGLLRRPVILHDHQGIEIDRTIPPWFRWAGRRWLSHYVGVSEKLGQWARNAGVAPSRVDVIGNALDLDRVTAQQAVDIRKEFGLEEQVIAGVVVAGLRYEKGLHVLIDAVSLCHAETEVAFLILGGWRDNEYEVQCRRAVCARGIERSIRFVGERTDARAVARGADFAVIPSLSESGPLVLIEYLAGGVPVVATRVGDVSLRAESLGVQEFVEPGDSGTLGRAINRLLAMSRSERADRGRLGIEVAQRAFNIRHSMPQWHNVYRKVLRDWSR